MSILNNQSNEKLTHRDIIREAKPKRLTNKMQDELKTLTKKLFSTRQDSVPESAKHPRIIKTSAVQTTFPQ